MKNLSLKFYDQYPFARKAKIFLLVSKTSNEIMNRSVGIFN